MEILALFAASPVYKFDYIDFFECFCLQHLCLPATYSVMPWILCNVYKCVSLVFCQPGNYDCSPLAAQQTNTMTLICELLHFKSLITTLRG